MKILNNQLNMSVCNEKNYKKYLWLFKIFIKSSAYYHWIVLDHKNELILVENIEFTRQKKIFFPSQIINKKNLHLCMLIN